MYTKLRSTHPVTIPDRLQHILGRQRSGVRQRGSIWGSILGSILGSIRSSIGGSIWGSIWGSIGRGVLGSIGSSGECLVGSSSVGQGSGSSVGSIGWVDNLRVVRGDNGGISYVSVSGGVGNGRGSGHQRGRVGQWSSHQSWLGGDANDGQSGNEDLERINKMFALE